MYVTGTQGYDDSGVYGTKGVASSGNYPGARYSKGVSWTSGQQLWLFGGTGYVASDFGRLNDLWAFDTATYQWTWVSGSSATDTAGVYGTLGVSDAGNVPGGGSGDLSWMETDGNLLMYGGTRGDKTGSSGPMNDVWKYTISTNQWTWLGGSDTFRPPGIYGTQGVWDITNSPPARSLAAGWDDGRGGLWLFGGWGTADVTLVVTMQHNELWHYTPTP